MYIVQAIIKFFIRLFFGGGKPDPVKPNPKPEEPDVQDPKPEEPEEVEPEPETNDYPITPEIMSFTLCLGNYDDDVKKADVQALLDVYHARIKNIVKPGQLRDGDMFDWVEIAPMPAPCVRTLQSFLVRIGILPKDANIDGIFAYRTQAAVRLFQEYNRLYTEGEEIMLPDGVVGPNTWRVIKAWDDAGRKVSHWTREQGTPEYNKWIEMLRRSKQHFSNSDNEMIQRVDAKVAELNANLSNHIDTLCTEDWNVKTDEIHLIGIRRREDESGEKRANDDIFVLLINGMVFKFWGSTDPKAKEGNRKDEAFLVEGQHKFRFGWHNISNVSKLYQGLIPYNEGVLVYRDDKATNDNSLTQVDMEKGIDDKPNKTIKIHWTGAGKSVNGTWSAGCQVIAGQSYIDQDNNIRNCRSFAATGSADLKKRDRTKAAYNMFADMVLVFRPDHNQDFIHYTLGRDDTLAMEFISDFDGEAMIAGTINEFGIRGLV